MCSSRDNMRTITSFVLIGTAVLLSACGSRVLTKEQNAYYDRAKLQPLSFGLPKAKSQDVWQCARNFVNEHRRTGMDIETESAIANKASSNPHFRYSISLSSFKDSTFFNVVVTATGTAGPVWDGDRTTTFADAARLQHTPVGTDSDAIVNAHTCAFFMVTGEIPPDGLVK